MVDLNDYFNPVSIEGPDFEHLTAQAGFLTISPFILIILLLKTSVNTKLHCLEYLMAETHQIRVQ